MRAFPRLLRVLLGIGAGIAVGIGATFLLDHDILAAVLGSVAAMAIADARGAVQCGTLGLVTGAGVGLFLGAMGAFAFSGSLPSVGPPGVVGSLAGASVVCGLVGAGYGFMTGRVRQLIDEGRAPFF